MSGERSWGQPTGAARPTGRVRQTDCGPDAPGGAAAVRARPQRRPGSAAPLAVSAALVAHTDRLVDGVGVLPAEALGVGLDQLHEPGGADGRRDPAACRQPAGR